MITIHKFLWHWIKIWPLRGTYMYSIFQNQGTQSCLGAASSCLVLPGLASSCLVWVFGNFQSIINVQWICISISNFAHVWYSLKTLSKPIKTSVASSHKHAWEWFIFGQTRQSKTKQEGARRRVASPRQDKKGVPWFWKILYMASCNRKLCHNWFRILR